MTGYLGAYRVLLSDLIVVTMAEPSFAVSGAGAPTGTSPLECWLLEESVRRLVPGVRVVHTVLRPFPLEPISGRRVFYATTAPASASEVLADHLEHEHGATVVGIVPPPGPPASSWRPTWRRLADADVLLVELKAAAVDLAARVGPRAGDGGGVL